MAEKTRKPTPGNENRRSPRTPARPAGTAGKKRPAAPPATSRPAGSTERALSSGGPIRLPGMRHDAELLYGRHAVLETLRAGRRRIHHIHLGQGLDTAETITDIVIAARRLGIPMHEAARPWLDRVVPFNHQGVVAEAAPYAFTEFDHLVAAAAQPDALYLALDHLQDVQNLGTLLRTAEAMQITGVLLPERRAAGITPAVVNASAGAVEHLPIAQVPNLVQALAQLKTANVWAAGLDAGAGSTPLNQADLTGRLIIVVGAEGDGLSRLVRERCDWLISIPMYGKVASLNAAVAGSIALVNARLARGKPHDI